jgi:hypothetical protein
VLRLAVIVHPVELYVDRYDLLVEEPGFDGLPRTGVAS